MWRDSWFLKWTLKIVLNIGMDAGLSYEVGPASEIILQHKYSEREGGREKITHSNTVNCGTHSST